MSLLLHKRAIQRAVLGELAPRREARLRAHLELCARCRDHYDGLARMAEALDAGRAAAARARARLFAALPDPPPSAGDERPPVAAAGRTSMRRRAWVGASLALAAATVVLVLVWPRDRDDVTWRGGQEPGTAPPATLVLYARSKAGPPGQANMRVAAELPGSGEARIARDEYLLFGLRGLRAPTHVRVSAVDDNGRVFDHVADTAVVPGPGPLTLGRSIDVARAHQPGRLRLVVLFSDKAIDDTAVRAAIARLDGAHADRGSNDAADTRVVSGLVVIAP